jgi:SAM-dependent methyltransferase
MFSALTRAWELSPAEEQYVDLQQGTHCKVCRANVRSMALARAILAFMGSENTLDAFLQTRDAASLRVLEVNEAGTLHGRLRLLPRHRLVAYPEHDLQHLVMPDESFDLVVHSDTLEHVPDPIQALSECRRVLTTKGRLAFTVPVIPGRLSRSREGMAPSFHGPPDCTDPGMLVHTEFGADCWSYVLLAGFSSCTMLPFCFPAGLAMLAER